MTSLSRTLESWRSHARLTRITLVLDRLNRAFRRSYAGARDAAIDEAPVLVVLGDDLILVRQRSRLVERFTPREFHVLKAIAHAPVALFVLLSMPGAHGRLAPLARRVQTTRDRLAALTDADVRARAERILDATAALASRAGGEKVPREALESFGAGVGPDLRRLIDDATALQLAALDRATSRMVDAMSAEERASFQVVVTGEHQARTRSLACQYFRKLLAEPEDRERRVLYAEGARSVEEATAVVRTLRVDRVLARTFFGDEDHMQRDLLGDAAARRLESFETSVTLEPRG